MATAIKVLDIPLVAAASQTAKQYYAMALDSSGNAAIASAAGQKCIGILQDDPASGQAGTYRVLGISKAIYGGTVDENDPLTTDANGKLVKATSNADHVLGRCMKAGVTGDIGEVMLGISEPAAGANGYVLSIPVTLAQITGAGDVVTTFTPGHKGKITKVDWATTAVVTTASKAASLNVEIGTTNVTGGVVALTSANCTPLGTVVAGSAVTAANEFTATDTISVEASSVTAFAEGAGVLLITIQ